MKNVQNLRLTETNDAEIQRVKLTNAIQEGINSGIDHDFDPKKHLESLKNSPQKSKS
jgi:antitoxin ParD1/3/4